MFLTGCDGCRSWRRSLRMRPRRARCDGRRVVNGASIRGQSSATADQGFISIATVESAAAALRKSARSAETTGEDADEAGGTSGDHPREHCVHDQPASFRLSASRGVRVAQHSGVRRRGSRATRRAAARSRYRIGNGRVSARRSPGAVARSRPASGTPGRHATAARAAPPRRSRWSPPARARPLPDRRASSRPAPAGLRR
jgi:hypothetical protein